MNARRGIAGMAALLLGACSLDLSALRASEGTGAEDGGPAPDVGPLPPPDGGPVLVADAGLVLRDAGSTASGFDAGPDAGSGSVDSFVREPDAGHDAGPPRCGAVGLPCCAGNGCTTGACLRGTCAAFGGAFARSTCAPGCADRNLYIAGCGCPSGFDERALGTLHTPCAETPVICESHPGNDYGGSYVRVGARCESAHPATSRCACPAGTTAMEVPLTLTGGDATLGVCLGEDVITLEGAFLVAAGCALPHASTAACLCPEGSMSQALGLGGGRTLHLCAR